MKPKRQKTASRLAVVGNKTDFSADITLLTQNATGRERLIIQLLHTTGITPKELVSLKRTDINTRTRTLHIRAETTKNNLPRTIPLTTQLFKSLVTHTQTHANEFLFFTRQSTQLSTRRIEQLLKELSEKTDITPITPRDLRNNYKELAAKHAKDDEELQQLTGLKTITKEQQLTIKELERINEALKKQPLRTRILVQTIIQTGHSLSHILSLKQQHISSLNISTQLEHKLRSLGTDYVFSSRQSMQLSERRAEQLLRQVGTKARIELTSHKLRTALRGGGI